MDGRRDGDGWLAAVREYARQPVFGVHREALDPEAEPKEDSLALHRCQLHSPAWGRTKTKRKPPLFCTATAPLIIHRNSRGELRNPGVSVRDEGVKEILWRLVLRDTLNGQLEGDVSLKAR